MRILLIHNAYQQRGGEDSVFEAEKALLQSYGHETHVYMRHNNELHQISKMVASAQTLWSRRSIYDLLAIAEQFKPDLIHSHNTFPLISPAMYWVAARLGVPVVQTLHNFRLLCIQAMFLRQGQICEDCLGTFPWRGLMHKCYRDSMTQSAALVGMLGLHRRIGTYQNKVTRYIALSRFCREKFISGGLPHDKITIKPNFVAAGFPPEQRRNGGLFVGRLAYEKGISVLAQALSQTGIAEFHVVGDGSQVFLLQGLKGVNLLRWQPAQNIHRLMQRASYLVVSSICYESFSMVVIEAYANGLPVIASRLGTLSELVMEGITGLLVEPSSADDLAEKMIWAETNPHRMREMGKNARTVYETHYTPEKNYEQLSGIYREAMQAYT